MRVKKFLCWSQHIFACIEGKCFLLQIRTTRRAFYNIFVSQICCNLFFLNSTSMKGKVSLLTLLFFFLWKKWFVCASWMICDRLCCSKYLSRPFSRLLSPTTKSCTNKEPLLSSSNIVLTGEQNKLSKRLMDMSQGYKLGRRGDWLRNLQIDLNRTLWKTFGKSWVAINLTSTNVYQNKSRWKSGKMLSVGATFDVLTGNCINWKLHPFKVK